MRSIWLALSVIAVANAVGLLAFVGWLGATGRLDRARVEQVRQIFVPTVAQTKAAEEAETAEAAEAARAAAERERLAKPGVTAEQELQSRFDATEIDRQRRQRIKDEIAQLQRILSGKVEELAQLNTQIAQARADFEDATRRAREQATDQQFKKTLGVLEGLKPQQAKTMLRTTIDSGEAGKDQAIAYLNAMEAETRTAVVQEFVKEDPKLAAELLERLRTRGIPPRAPGEPAR